VAFATTRKAALFCAVSEEVTFTIALQIRSIPGKLRVELFPGRAQMPGDEALGMLSALLHIILTEHAGEHRA
jgi:hypothetical protein